MWPELSGSRVVRCSPELTFHGNTSFFPSSRFFTETIDNTKMANEKPVEDGYQLTAKDDAQLKMTDEEYKLMTWEDLKLIICEPRALPRTSGFH